MRLTGRDRMADSRMVHEAMARRGRRRTDNAARGLYGSDRRRVACGNGLSLFADFQERFRGGPWLIALAFLLGSLELASAKLNLLPRPFFAAPQSLLAVYMEDWPRLVESTLRSFMLLVSGYSVGALVGFFTGLAIGWSRAIGYWLHPVLRLMGPCPPRHGCRWHSSYCRRAGVRACF